MEGDIDVRRVGVERLADHQHGLAVRIGAGAEERDVGRKDEVAGGFLPRKMEGVLATPHVLAAAGDCVGL